MHLERRFVVCKHTRTRILENALQQQYARVHNSLSSPHSCIPSTLRHRVLEGMVHWSST